MKLSTFVVLGALVACVFAGEDKAECGRCVMKHRPVCGRDSNGRTQTFANSCTLRRDNCVHHTDYNQIRKGSC